MEINENLLNSMKINEKPSLSRLGMQTSGFLHRKSSWAGLQHRFFLFATVAISLLIGLVVIGVLGKKLRQLISSQKMALRVNRAFGVIMIGVGFSLLYF